MAKIFILGSLFLCSCIALLSFLPASSQTYIKIKPQSVNLNGIAVKVEPRVNSINEKAAMKGHVYLHYKPAQLEAKGCMLEASLLSVHRTSSSGRLNCRSDDKTCNSDISQKDKTVRMFLDIKNEPVSTLPLTVSLLSNLAGDGKFKCEETVVVNIIPEWYRPSFWETLFSR